MTTVLSLYLQTSLDDLDNHKEKPLTWNLEPDIDLNWQTKVIYKTNKIIKKICDIQSLLEVPKKHSMAPLTCDLEPDIVVRWILM